MKTINIFTLYGRFEKRTSAFLKLVWALAIVFIFSSSCQAQNNRKLNKEGKSKVEVNRKQAPAKANIQVVFPLNEYLTTIPGSPYPVLVNAKLGNINTSSFVNVMSFGASGNGVTPDDAAIVAAFAACKDGGGVIFPIGKTFLIKKLERIPLDKSITVYAYGATIKMAANTGYNGLAFEAPKGGYKYSVKWLGGTLDGNKNQQTWPGSPTGNNKWAVAQGNYGILTVCRAEFALIKDVRVTNSVYDGVNFYDCKLGVFANSKADGGAPLNYGSVKDGYEKGHQSTYFKATRTGSQAAYFLDLETHDGSIGVQYSAGIVGENSLAVVSNCKFYNPSQDAIHFEHCLKVFVNKCTIESTDAAKYHADIHVSNITNIASIRNCDLKNGRIDFRNGASLEYCAVENCNFEGTRSPTDGSTVMNMFIDNGINVRKCTFKGQTADAQVRANAVSESVFENFDVALKAPLFVSKNTFNNGRIAIQNPKNGLIVDESIFNNLSNGINFVSKPGEKPVAYLLGSSFTSIQGNALKISDPDTLFIDNSKFSNFGLNTALSESDRSALSLADKSNNDGEGTITVQNSSFIKERAGASGSPFNAAMEKKVTSLNLKTQGVTLGAMRKPNVQKVIKAPLRKSRPIQTVTIIDGNNKLLGNVSS